VVEEASRLHPDAVTPDAWHGATAALRDAIATLRKRAQDRVAGGPSAVRDPWFVPALDAGAAAADSDAGN